MAVFIFLLFVGFVIGLSFYLGRKTKSAGGYFAAGGQIHWAVNGIAFAGDYLSAASFLGICGMIATMGYDGFLYSIGYLAGWIVALFVVAEPLKRMGKYTFTDALDAKFNSKGIKLAAALSTLIVSICYLIPQMVGAGVLVEPLLGMEHSTGVIMVGVIVILIVATAGMTSTTYVQFLKGGLLIVFSTVLVIAVCVRGLSTEPAGAHDYKLLSAADVSNPDVLESIDGKTFARVEKDGVENFYYVIEAEGAPVQYQETQWVLERSDGDGKKGATFINGVEKTAENADTLALRQVGTLKQIAGQKGKEADTGAISPFKLLALLSDKETVVQRWSSASIKDGNDAITVYYPFTTPGNKVMRPGLMFKVEGTPLQRLDFVSLMLALFFGTAALPHILIRYYTVPSPAAARKSTIVAIASIGFFYILTLFMGLGAMVNSVVNPLTNNMSAPLLAQSFGTFLFAVISAIAFATVLGTVSGLIVAASGAVAHDLLDRFAGLEMTEKTKVGAGKVAAIVVGIIAIILGIKFRGMNVSFLVGWAFAVAASANLPAIIMLLFWKKTTKQGITVSIIVGIVAAIGLFLISPSMYPKYGLAAADAPFPLMNPGIVSIPLSFATLIVISLLTQPREPQSA